MLTHTILDRCWTTRSLGRLWQSTRYLWCDQGEIAQIVKIQHWSTEFTGSGTIDTQ